MCVVVEHAKSTDYGGDCSLLQVPHMTGQLLAMIGPILGCSHLTGPKNEHAFESGTPLHIPAGLQALHMIGHDAAKKLSLHAIGPVNLHAPGSGIPLHAATV
jgi:hypothetical protein